MTPIATPSAAAPQGGTAKTATATLGKNYTDFLSLLMTQLKNQDPTSPMDTNQFTSQLVQFSSVEQQINTNSSLNTLIGLQQGNQVLQSSSLVGKTVQVTSNQIDLQRGHGAVQFATASPSTVTMTVTSASGQTLRTATVQTAGGNNTWKWDGLDDSGRTLPDGPYTLGIALAGSGKDAPSTAVPFTVSGIATGVQNTATGMAVQLGSLQVPLTAVQAIQ